MTYTRRGTQLIATLLVTIMILSVFAMPVAAEDGIDDEAEIEFDADEIETEETEDFRIYFDDDDSDADDGDQINVTFDENIDDSEDFELTDAELDGVSESNDLESEDNVTVETDDSGSDLAGDDRVVITLDFFGDDSQNLDNTWIDVNVTLEAQEQAADKADDYDGDTVASITEDDTGELSQESAVTIDIEPGLPADLNLDLDDDEAAFGGDSIQATAELLDAQGNLNESVDVDDQTDVNFTVTGVTFEEEVTGESIEASGTTSIDLQDESGDIDWEVGSFDIDVEEDEEDGPEGYGTDGDEFDVYPDQLDLEIQSGSIEADDEADVQVEIKDDSNYAITDSEIDSVDVEVNLTDFTPDDGDVDEPSLAELDGDAFNTTIEDASFEDESNTGVNTTEFNATTAGNYDLEANLLPDVAEADTIDDDDIDVEPADEISAIESVEVEHDLVGVVIDDNNDVEVDIEGIEDAFENNITGSENDVQIEVGDINEQDGASDGSVTISFDPEDIDAAEVGEDDVIAQDATEQDELESATIELQHEAYDADSGWNLVSVPMDTDSVATEDMSELFYWTGEEYLPLSEADQPLHHGYYTEAESSDARWGMTFNTTEDPSVGGIETVDDGWNLVGTNFNISDSSSETIDNDLRGINDLSDEPRLEANYEGTFVSGSQSVDEFDAYWVFRGSDLGTLEERGLTVAPYDPDSR